MDDITNITAAIKYRYFTSSKTDKLGRRTLSAAIKYDRAINDDEKQTTREGNGIVTGAGGTGAVAEMLERVKPSETREVSYSTRHANKDLASFISDTIAFTLQDSIEQRVRPINIHIKLASDVNISNKIAQFIADWYEVDPSINTITMNIDDLEAVDEQDEI